MFKIELSSRVKTAIKAGSIIFLIMLASYLFINTASIVKIIFYTLNILFLVVMIFAILNTITDKKLSLNSNVDSSLLAKNLEYELFGNIYEFWLYKNKDLILYKYNLSSFIIIEDEIYIDQYASIEIKNNQYIVKFLDKIIELQAQAN